MDDAHSLSMWGITDSGVLPQHGRIGAAIVRELQWRGPLEVEVMRDTQGRYQLIEINPRFPAWIFLSTGVGRNLPWALVQLALGQTPAEFPPAVPGVLFIRRAQEMIVPMTQFETMVTVGALDFSDKTS